MMLLPLTLFAVVNYDAGDIAAINAIIDAHPEMGLSKAPADGSYVPGDWNGKVVWNGGTPNRVAELKLDNKNLTGTLDVSGLPTLAYLYCNNNQLTGVVLNSTAQYVAIDVRYNCMANSSAITGQTISWDTLGYFPFSPQRDLNCVITYNANRGSGTMPNSAAYQGVPFKLPSNGFTSPTGQEFATWAIGDVGTGQRVNPGDFYSFTGDTTVYAIWKVIMTQVTPTWTQGSDQSATFTSSADFDDFLEVWLNDGTRNILVDRSNYDLERGSIIVKFKASFLNSLPPGNYSVEIAAKTGSAFGTLEIKGDGAHDVTQLGQPKTKVPRTGDNMNIYLWPGLLVFAAGGLAVLLRRKTSK